MASQNHEYVNLYWFNVPKDQVYQRLWPYIQFLKHSQNYVTQQNLRNMNLYGDYDAMGLSPYEYTRTNSINMSGAPKVTMNVCKAMCDTAQAKLSENEPLPFLLTEGGDWSQQQKAKKLNQFAEGLFYENHVFEIGQEAFLDATIFGTGFLKVFKEDDKVQIERVMPNEVVVDDNQAVFGKPNMMSQCKYLSRDVLMSAFPKFKKQIELVPQSKVTLQTSHAYVHDIVEVIETWRLPTAKDAGDGIHCIIIENVTLFYEKWEKNYFPLIPLRWSKLPVGYFGKGICASLVGIQIEINMLLRTITKSLRLLGVPRVLLPMGSKINPAHLNDEVGALIYHAPGMQPQVWNQPIMPPEIYQHLRDLKSDAYEVVGINQLSAAAQKPAGLDSGIALETMADIQTQRFATVEKAYQRMFLEVARQSFLLAREIYEETGSYIVSTHNTKNFQRINWGDIDLSSDDYVMKAWPTNLLPKTPSGKLQQVTEMMAKGLLDQDEGRSLLNYPDLESTTSLKNAPRENIMRTIERIVEDGDYRAPEPYQNLQMGIQLVQEALLHYEDLGVSQNRLEMLRVWLDTADSMLQAQAPTAGQAPQGQPPAQAQPQPGQMIQPAAPLAPLQQ